MGLFDSIRRVVGSGESATDDGGEDLSGLVDTNTLDEAALRRHAEDVAGEVDQLDFSPESLEQFDSAIDAGYDEELATADDSATYGTDVVRFGCYLGEVLVRRYDGEWTNDPQWGVTITGSDDSATVSVFEVAQRSIKTKAVFSAVTERAAEDVGLEGDGGETAGANADAVSADAMETEADATDTDPDDWGESPAESQPPESDDLSTDDAAALVEEAEPETAREPNVDSTETNDPTQGDGLRAEYAAEAEAFVSFWNEHDLDYTPESLTRLDDLVADEWDDDRFDDAEFGSEATFDDRAFTSVSRELGSYFGEVLVRELDGEWTDETTNDSVVVTSPDGPLAIPVFRVAGTSLTEQPVFQRSYDSLLSDIDP